MTNFDFLKATPDFDTRTDAINTIMINLHFKEKK